ncbi:telomere zinc finger-associated protein-like [Neocloeon triangulifer]|uniref:telomere zinc finger-associated protein-like n=1 Tax=Neocloeon triangulifer TaxID=2078957 RepID=UPI00286F6705|nr:telomere zinc finger-associated protein-like [Neocloeon triangulifer]
MAVRIGAEGNPIPPKTEYEEPELDEQQMRLLNGNLWCSEGTYSTRDLSQQEINPSFYLQMVPESKFLPDNKSAIVRQKTIWLPLQPENGSSPLKCDKVPKKYQKLKPSSYEQRGAPSNHHKDVIIWCDQENCFKFFQSEDDRNLHKKEVHKGGDKETDVYEQSTQEDIGHTKAPTILPCQTLPLSKPKGMATCNFCNSVFASTNLMNHILRQHKGVAFKCNKCTLFFKAKKDCDLHKKLKHGQPRCFRIQVCIYCKRRYSDKKCLSHHVIRKHNKEVIKCVFSGCGEMFLTPTERDSHFEDDHANEARKKNLACDTCPYKTHTKKLLKIHFIRRHFPRIFKCKFCTRRFPSQKLVQFHKRQTHSSSHQRYCPHCQKSMSVTYINTHAAEVNCGVCSNTFGCLRLLKNHESECRKLKSMGCLKCKISFENRFELRKHWFECDFKIEKLSTKIHVKPLNSLICKP